jgi:hypothetical protein
MNSGDGENDLALMRAVLEKAGVEIRSEPCGGEGGLVRMGDRSIVFVPLHSPKPHAQRVYLDSIKKLASSLGHIPPRIRQLLGEEDWNGK